MSNFENLDKLSQSLYQELIEKAEVEIAEKQSQAEKERDKLLQEAKAKADGYFKEAERKLKQKEAAQLNELKQKALQLKQDLQNDILHLIQKDWVNPSLKRSLEDQELIKALILNLAERINQGSYQLEVPEDLIDEWKAFISDKLTNLELIKSDDLKFKLISVDEGFQMEFGEREFQTLFEEYISEDLAHLMFGHD